MASLTIRFDVSGLGDQILQNVVKTGGSGQVIDEAIPDETTDQLVTFAVDLSHLKAIVLLSDQALTLKTNSSGAPQETIVLAAGVPVYYAPGDAGQTSPFAGDITALYVTNASGETATLKIRCIEDPTP